MPDTLSGSGNELPPPASASNTGVRAGGAARLQDSRGHWLPFLRRAAVAAFGGRSPAARPAASGTVALLTRDDRLLRPYDSLAIVHAALRRSASGALCVGVGGYVMGVLSLAALNRVLAANLKYLGGDGDRSPGSTPLSALLDGPEPLLALDEAPRLSAAEPLANANATFDTDLDSPLAIVFADGPKPVYVGVLYRSDMIAAALGNLAPARVGGMATPLGVYLTDGLVQGGAGNLGLVLAGVSMGILVTTSRTLSALAVTWLEGRYPSQVATLITWSYRHLVPYTVGSLWSGLAVALAMPITLILLRLIPVAGYHAAEHQVVHCLERGEPLIPENVRRMPRVHPRCGTNLVAALSILTLAILVGFGMTGSISGSVVPGVLVTALTWRSVGSALQQFLTTRPASDKQIASGIRAAHEIVDRSLAHGLERNPTMAQRVWNVGFVQMLAGVYLVAGLLDVVARLFPAVGRYLVTLA